MPWTGFDLTTLVVTGIDCIGRYKSICHTIRTTTTPLMRREKFKDIKAVIRNRKLKKGTQYKGQKEQREKQSTKHYTINKSPLKPGVILKRAKRKIEIYKTLHSKQKPAKTRG